MTRQQLLDSLAPPRSYADVVAILSTPETILRDITIASLIYDSKTARLNVWGGTAPATTPPLYSWDLATFFDAPTANSTTV